MQNKDVMASIATTDERMHIKRVPGYQESGYLDPRAKEEITPPEETDSVNEAAVIPDVAMMRAMMGWPAAKDIATHEILVTNTDFAGIPVRSYVKKERANEVLPAVVFYHGGGFFGGSLDNVDLPCRRIADLGDIRVFSVDYGLAPENPYPKGIIDAYQALVYVKHHHEALKVNEANLNVMGDSAGGNLTYVMSLLDRLYGTNCIQHAVSLYPVVYQGKNEGLLQDFYNWNQLNIQADEALIHQYATGFSQSFSAIDAWYIRDADAESMMISPYNADAELLAKLPKTLFMVGEFDALRPQGEAFYEKAKQAGADIYYLRYDGMVHAFMDKVGDYLQGDDCLKEAVQFMLADD
ncbi:alpha/beta hydrolase [Isobaculum melis]|uniref:Acetyl esterase/lipase n=1 Tax=Isobaculum melis TaxID=142588 RepID=A0A1H9QW14_9LACT|nr:alpha/beta hydrolase [Isobaculum melis]SER64672.1 Acetyl esterase/lipase [Isobaculum melis]